MKKNIVLIAFVWVLSIVLNISVAFFYPDTEVSVLNLGVSLICILVLAYIVYKLIAKKQYMKVKYIGIIGVFSGFFVAFLESLNTG